MAITTRRKEIEDRLYEVVVAAGAGNVLRGRHRLEDPDDFYNLFSEKERADGDRGELLIKGWELYRTSVEHLRVGDARIPGVATNHVGIIHSYQLDGVYGYDPKNDSEEGFNDMVDTMMNTLGDTVTHTPDGGYTLRVTAATANLGLDEISGYMVHVAEITFTVEENVTRT